MLHTIMSKRASEQEEREKRKESPAPAPPPTPAPAAGWLTRRRTSALALLAATGVAFYLCWKIAQPFAPALAWALALAIIGSGLHRWLLRRLAHPGLCAGLATTVLIVFIATPIAATAPTVATKVKEGWEQMRSVSTQERVQKVLRSSGALAPVADIVARYAPSGDELAEQLAPRLPSLATGSLWAGVQLLVSFFALFYLLRDREQALAFLRTLSPLTGPETSRLFQRVADVVRATVLGTLLVAAVQGLLGGLMFWWLDLPAPLLWGVVMFLLSVLPILGAAIVWVPTALLLLMEGSWEKALILTVWGTVVIALIDNLLYPVFVGNKLRLHTLLVFIAILGGLLLFGASGLILGPIVLAVTLAVIDIWRERTAAGHTADGPPAPPPPPSSS
jgi:predicted PurR-regulated permease PerM